MSTFVLVKKKKKRASNKYKIKICDKNCPEKTALL